MFYIYDLNCTDDQHSSSKAGGKYLMVNSVKHLVKDISISTFEIQRLTVITFLKHPSLLAPKILSYGLFMNYESIYKISKHP